ncbi:MAG: coproporphyrinogen III oxidase [Deltaproteobacteria bacterium HGW-Deltaproteobacteria-8]|jgi:oxygen-independent coproporphyrinogen-3 oxidase|nr:MAG: coproporphyrinogen III oxidase [Deltaproteobacteria bacterium HGW-Deltaproteobacteria-8]
MCADARPASPTASLYIHVPFCRSKCGYCAFFSEPLREGAQDAYLPLLLDEMALWAQRLGRLTVPTVFFGGGTPSLLQPEHLARIMEALRQHFDLAPDAEISMEANPESASPDFLRAARALGVNRLSLGVQSFRDEELALLGRPHTARQAAEALARARAAGFTNLGLDLIWGLPGQREGQWLESLRRAVELAPEHLSCYGLTLEPGTPLAEAPEEQRQLPPERELAHMYVHTGELLEDAGYMQYEISNYAHLGQACRHNQACWEGRDYLGLGPAAASTLGHLRSTNPESLSAWAELVRTRRIGLHQRETLTPEIRASERLMLALRTSKGLDLAEYRALSGHNLLSRHKSIIQALRQKELIRIHQGRLRLTRTGMLVSNSIIRALGFE